MGGYLTMPAAADGWQPEIRRSSFRLYRHPDCADMRASRHGFEIPDGAIRPLIAALTEVSNTLSTYGKFQSTNEEGNAPQWPVTVDNGRTLLHGNVHPYTGHEESDALQPCDTMEMSYTQLPGLLAALVDIDRDAETPDDEIRLLAAGWQATIGEETVTLTRSAGDMRACVGGGFAIPDALVSPLLAALDAVARHPAAAGFDGADPSGQWAYLVGDGYIYIHGHIRTLGIANDAADWVNWPPCDEIRIHYRDLAVARAVLANAAAGKW